MMPEIVTTIPLEQIFNQLIDSFIENKVGIAEHFLNEELAAHLKR
jgi:SM-20-related protein